MKKYIGIVLGFVILWSLAHLTYAQLGGQGIHGGPQDLSSGSSPTFVTIDLTGVTDGNVPYMSAAGAGFADSPLSVSGGNVASSGSVTVGTTAAGKNLTVNATLGAELAPALTEGNWTVGAGWESPIVGPGLIKNADGTGTQTPSAATTIVAGTTYKVVITLSAWSVGTATYTLGGVTGTTLAAATTYTDYITAATTGKLIITPSSTSRFTISAISYKALTDATGDVTVEGNLTVKSPASFAGNVGIGTTTPTVSLELKSATPKILLTDTDNNDWSIYTSSLNNLVLRDESNSADYATFHGGGGFTIPNITNHVTFGSALKLLNTGLLGIGTTSPDKAVEINSATGANLRLTYDDSNGSASNYVDFAVPATGDLTVTPSGGDASVTGNLSTSTANITEGSGTGITVNHTGKVNRQVYQVTTTFAAYTDSDTTKGIVIATLPAKTKIVGFYSDTTAAYTGGTVSAATLEVGVTAEGGAEILAAHDVKTAAVTKGLADADMGTSMTRAAQIQGGYLPSWTGTTAIYATIDTTDGNTSALTTGSTTFYITTERY